MVSRSTATNLMIATWTFAYIYERSRGASEIQPIQNVQVKGQNFILSTLKNIQPFIESLSITYPTIIPTSDSIRDWLSYLEKKYPEPNSWGANLDQNDAKKLAKDSFNWYESLLKAYGDKGTILINEENFEKVFTIDLLSKLELDTKNDLLDGFSAIIHLLPTPAAMILFRVAESVVRKYYKKITGNSAGKKRWVDLLDDLEKTPNIKKSLLKYIHYIRDERNEAEHPDKRYSKEESEKILLRIKDLLVELENE
jgi:hypothetical protein